MGHYEYGMTPFDYILQAPPPIISDIKICRTTADPCNHNTRDSSLDHEYASKCSNVLERGQVHDFQHRNNSGLATANPCTSKLTGFIATHPPPGYYPQRPLE